MTLYQLPDHRPEHRSPLVRQSLGLPSRNCSPRRGVGSAFRASPFQRLPRAKAPTSQRLRRGWLFGVTYHSMRGAIASATAAWANLFSRCAAIQTPISGLTFGSPAKNVQSPAGVANNAPAANPDPAAAGSVLPAHFSRDCEMRLKDLHRRFPGSTSLDLRHLLRRRNFFVRSRNRHSGLCQSGSAGLTPLSTKRPLPCLRKLLQFAPRDNTQMVNRCATMGVVQEKRVGTQMHHRHCRG